MPYDPSLTPIAERIVLHVISTLEAIQGPPTYATTVKKVRRWDGNAFDIVDFPTIVLTESDEEQDDQVGKIIRSELPMQLTLVLLEHGPTGYASLRKFASDVRVALTNDWTRGGIALDTKIERTRIFDSVPSDPVLQAQIDFRCRFRTLYHDPTTAQ